MDNRTLSTHFPIFAAAGTISQPLIYLDNAATTQKPKSVIDSISNFYSTANANVHRGLYPLAEKATTLYEDVRNTVAQFINAYEITEIVFTKGTTEAINLIAHSWGSQHLANSDVILLSQVEHHANLLPWLELARKNKLVIRYIPYDAKTKKLSLVNIDLTGVKLLAVQHTSNVLGNVWDDNFANLYSLITEVKKGGGAVLLDAAQSIAHLPIDVQSLQTDFFVFSGHKVYGPTGIGVLYIHKRWHNDLQPYQVGGSMILSVSYENATWGSMPHLLEAGTPPIASAIGLQTALNFMAHYAPFSELTKHETMLCMKLAHALGKIPGIHIATAHENVTNQHMVSFYHDTVHAHDLASFLGEKNIAVRAGNHCAQPLIDLLNIPALVRVSIGMYNTQQDVDAILQALTATINHLTV